MNSTGYRNVKRVQALAKAVSTVKFLTNYNGMWKAFNEGRGHSVC